LLQNPAKSRFRGAPIFNRLGKTSRLQNGAPSRRRFAEVPDYCYWIGGWMGKPGGGQNKTIKKPEIVFTTSGF
jgi:hypothetical protein